MKVFSALSFCISIYLFGYLMEINSTALEDMIFWNQVQYLGLPFFPPLWVIVALFFKKRVNIFLGWKQILFLLIPCMTFFMRLTNSYHHLYYRSMTVQHTAVISLLFLGKGPWYYVHSLYLFICMMISTTIFYIEYIKSKQSENMQYPILFLASFIPCFGLCLILLDYLGLGIDYTALLMPVSMALIMYAIYRYDFLEVKTLARETLFENSSDGMLLLDIDNRIIDYNKAIKELFPTTMMDCDLVDLLGDKKDLIDVFKSVDSHDFMLPHGGEEKFFEISSSVIRNVSGNTIGVLKSVRDITENKKLQKKLNIMATVDELSGINNRRHFMELAQKEFERSKRYGQTFCVLMMDIDFFKSINDTRGHAGGDTVIRMFGSLMKVNFRKSDILGRLGGEEFAVILTNTPIDEARLAAEKFREAVSKAEMCYESLPIPITISIGVSSFFNESESFDEILKYADEAMYVAKAQGRNRIALKNMGL